VCLSSSKRGILFEQNKFKQWFLSFDDNKVLKVQSNMLIFVQVCRTTKIYYVLINVLVLKEHTEEQ